MTQDVVEGLASLDADALTMQGTLDDIVRRSIGRLGELDDGRDVDEDDWRYETSDIVEYAELERDLTRCSAIIGKLRLALNTTTRIIAQDEADDAVFVSETYRALKRTRDPLIKVWFAQFFHSRRQWRELGRDSPAQRLSADPLRVERARLWAIEDAEDRSIPKELRDASTLCMRLSDLQPPYLNTTPINGPMERVTRS